LLPPPPLARMGFESPAGGGRSLPHPASSAISTANADAAVLTPGLPREPVSMPVSVTRKKVAERPGLAT
jgi:hypothetical protein